jgi:uncharacterized protein involved in oxidation of intracellular sulfur
MKTLVILNDPPYGTERSYNGLRLAASIARKDGEEVRVFLMGDAASCAKAGQKVPTGYYNIQTMLGSVTRRGGSVGVSARAWTRVGSRSPSSAKARAEAAWTS